MSSACGGSLADKSSSLRAVRVALDAAEQAGATSDLLDVRDLALPFYGRKVSANLGVSRLVEATAARPTP